MTTETNRYHIKAGYRARDQVQYYEDKAVDEESTIWQPEVYLLAAHLGHKLNCRYIVDIGCGGGQKLTDLYPDFEIIGVDFGSNLEACRKQYPFGTWLEVDLNGTEMLPISEDVLRQAVIVCADVIEHLVDPLPLLERLRSLLLSAPVALLSSPDRDRLAGPDDFGPPTNLCHAREWNGDELADLLAEQNLPAAVNEWSYDNNIHLAEATILKVLAGSHAPQELPAMVADFKVAVRALVARQSILPLRYAEIAHLFEPQAEPPIPASPRALHPAGLRPGLPVPADLPQPKRPTRVCIVSNEFVGPVRNGGIGTALTSLANALAEAGQQVTLLYLQGNQCENGRIEDWVRHYQKAGITFVPLPSQFNFLDEVGSHIRASYEAYHWLKTRTFDVIHFTEWRAGGYYSLLAKRQGLAFANTTLCVGSHSPLLWTKEANRQPITDPSELEVDYMERRSVEMADVVVCPSQYLLDWEADQGWDLPADCFVQQNVRPSCGAPDKSALPDRHRVRELVFFGRIEDRKGVEIFCDALDILKNEIADLSVTFLGRIATVNGKKGDVYIGERAQNWPWPWQVISTYDQPQATAYLHSAGRLAVIPSLLENSPNTVLECLIGQIPFAASNTGGIPELIHADDRPAVCFEPRALPLAEHLRTAVRDGVALARVAVDPEENQRGWVNWHIAQQEHPYTQQASVEACPKVSVCLVTHNRPDLLRQAVASLKGQDYRNYEVVLVDDGSTRPEAVACLRELQALFNSRGWKIVRQENRYLGAARNTAVRHASGEYVLIMDDDNYARPNEISTFVRAAQYSGADILTCAEDMFFTETPPAAGTPNSPLWLPLGGAALAGVFRNVYGDANALFRREVLERLGGFSEDYGTTCEDWEFFSRASLNGVRLEVVPESLFWYRVSSGSMLRSTKMFDNLNRAARPYMAAVPPALQGIFRLAQTLRDQRGQAMAAVEEIKSVLEIESLLIAANELATAGLLERAEVLLRSALAKAEKIENQVALEKAYAALQRVMSGKKSAGVLPTAARPAAKNSRNSAAETFDLLIGSGNVEAALKKYRSRLDRELVKYIRARAAVVAGQGERDLAGALRDLAGIVEGMM